MNVVDFFFLLCCGPFVGCCVSVNKVIGVPRSGSSFGGSPFGPTIFGLLGWGSVNIGERWR